MTREELLRSHSYHSNKIGIDLYDMAMMYTKEHGMTDGDFARHAGMSAGQVRKLFNGATETTVDDMCKAAMACGYVPQVELVPTEVYALADKEGSSPVHDVKNPVAARVSMYIEGRKAAIRKAEEWIDNLMAANGMDAIDREENMRDFRRFIG